MSSDKVGKQQIHICLACDDKYAQHTAVTITSVLKNVSDDVFLNFYVMSSSLTNRTKSRLRKSMTKYSDLKFIDINESDFSDCPIRKDFHLTLETYFRLKMSTFFKDVEKIIYLDSDIVVLGDISELWNTDITNFYLACVPNLDNQRFKAIFAQYVEFDPEFKYYNAGVLLVNLKKWREENIERKLFDYIDKNGDTLLYADQDVLNCVINRDILYLDECWNAQFLGHKPCPENAKLIHYITRTKPWNTFSQAKEYSRYFENLKRTDWRFQAFSIKTRLMFAKLKIFMHNFFNLMKINCFFFNKKFFVWGASLFMEDLLKKYPCGFFNIAGFIDIDKNKQGQKFCEYRIYSPDELPDLHPDVIVSGVINNPKLDDIIENEVNKHGAKLIRKFFIKEGETF